MLTYEKSISVEKKVAYQDKVYSGNEKKILMFGIKDKEWNFSFGRVKYESYDVYGEKKQVQLLDHLFLPAYYGTKYAKEYTMVEKNHTEEEMKKIMDGEWDKLLQTLEEKGVEITGKNVTIKKNDNKWVLNAKMQLVEAAVKKVNSTTKQITFTESEEEAEVSDE